MIEFTVLELTLIVLCIGLFIYAMPNRTKTKAMCQLVDAMCKDEGIFREIKRAVLAREEA
jgi:hypothetical protein